MSISKKRRTYSIIFLYLFLLLNVVWAAYNWCVCDKVSAIVKVKDKQLQVLKEQRLKLLAELSRVYANDVRLLVEMSSGLYGKKVRIEEKLGGFGGDWSNEEVIETISSLDSFLICGYEVGVYEDERNIYPEGVVFVSEREYYNCFEGTVVVLSNMENKVFTPYISPFPMDDGIIDVVVHKGSELSRQVDLLEDIEVVKIYYLEKVWKRSLK